MDSHSQPRDHYPMNTINPELDLPPEAGQWTGKRKTNPAFREAVGRLFGRSDGLIVRAVDDFLAKNPGSLDQQNLRLVAAAAPFFSDSNHVALMIDRLPITEMKVALAPIDLEETTAYFGHVVPNFSPRASQKLVMDLARASILDVVGNSPPERVPEAGRNFVADHLVKQMKSGLRAVERALVDPLVNERIVSAALDSLESALQHPEQLDSNAATYARECVSLLISERTSHATPDDALDRAWRLAQKITPLMPAATTQSMLRNAVGNDRLIARHAGSMVDMLYRLDTPRPDTGQLRPRMLVSPTLFEVLTARVARGSRRYWRDENARLAAWRLEANSNGTANSNETPSAREIDLALVSGSLSGSDTWASMIEDPEALTILAGRARELDKWTRHELINNPNLDSSHVETLLNDVLENIAVYDMWSGFDQESLNFDVGHLLTFPKLDDQQLARLVEKMTSPLDVDPLDIDRRNVIVTAAACNASSGPAVFDKLQDFVARMEDDSTSPDVQNRWLRAIATNTASRHVQQQIASLALERRDESLARSLYRNGMLRKDVHGCLTEFVPDDEPMIVSGTLESPTTDFSIEFDSSGEMTHSYTIEDIAKLISSGEAPDGRADQLLTEAQQQNHTLRERLHEIAGPLLEGGFVSDQTLSTMMADNDTHFALSFATHPSQTENVGRYVPAGPKMLVCTGQLLAERSAFLPHDDRDVTSWSQLPQLPDVILPHGHLHALLDGRDLEGLKLRVPKTRRELEALADDMGNCIVSYTDSIARGHHVLAYARDGRETYAAMWWAVPSAPGFPDNQVVQVELNSRFNQRNVPEPVKNAVSELTEKINRGELRPVEVENKALEQAEPTRLIRPPRRDPLPALAPVLRPAEPDADVAPSVLGRSAEGDPRPDVAEVDGAPSIEQPDGSHRPPGDIGHDVSF